MMMMMDAFIEEHTHARVGKRNVISADDELDYKRQEVDGEEGKRLHQGFLV